MRCRRVPLPMQQPFVTPRGCPWVCVMPGSEWRVLRGYWEWALSTAAAGWNGAGWRCRDCGVHVGEAGEYSYMLTRSAWAATWLGPNEGKLCVGCLEIRLGRPLHRGDFDWSVPLNTMQWRRSARLREAMARPEPT